MHSCIQDINYDHLHVVSFPRRELSSALEYVRQRASITRGSGDDARPTIHTTGVGCTQHGSLIADTFNVKSVYQTCIVLQFATDQDNSKSVVV